jgi:hypothetical protein
MLSPVDWKRVFPTFTENSTRFWRRREISVTAIVGATTIALALMIRGYMDLRVKAGEVAAAHLRRESARII